MVATSLNLFILLLPLHSGLPQDDIAAPQVDQDCAAYTGFGYFCVPYYQCNRTGFINTDGNSIIDPRSADDDSDPNCPDHDFAQRGHCEDLLEVCCLNPGTCKPREKKPRDDYYSGYEDYGEYDEDYYDDYNEDTNVKEDNNEEEGCKTDDIFDERGKEKNTFKDCNKENKCESYASQGFACAEYWRCLGKNLPIISDGDGIIDLRQNRKDLWRCINVENITLDASDDKCQGDNQVCCKNPDLDARICDPEESGNFAECGRTNRRREGRVLTVTQLIVSNAAQPGEFPHMCVIYKVKNGKKEYIGGASLISRTKVITVAHKFLVSQKGSRGKKIDERKHKKKFLVRCGEYNVKAETDIQPHQETGISSFYFHPQYDPSSRFVPNDLVIIETDKPFIYQEHIGPVCLPRPNDNFESDEDCWSSGWGKDQFGKGGKFSDILKKIDMRVVDDRTCQKKLRKFKRFLRSFKVDASQVCVGGERNKDTCTGDGGSPHVCLRDNKWTQVGAVAWGIGCGESIPAIYASIPDAMCWIDWVMSCRPSSSSARTMTRSSSARRRSKALRSQVKSVNGLTDAECEKWAEENENLLDDHECQVEYELDVLHEIFSYADSDIFADSLEYYDLGERGTKGKREQRDFRG